MTGEIKVEHQKVHVAHDEELRCHHLSKLEQVEIVDKLKSGVTSDRILQDARELTDDKLQRINLLTRKDISYLSKKHHVHNKRHEDDTIATVLKVQEWNVFI